MPWVHELHVYDHDFDLYWTAREVKPVSLIIPSNFGEKLEWFEKLAPTLQIWLELHRIQVPETSLLNFFMNQKDQTRLRQDLYLFHPYSLSMEQAWSRKLVWKPQKVVFSALFSLVLKHAIELRRFLIGQARTRQDSALMREARRFTLYSWRIGMLYLR